MGYNSVYTMKVIKQLQTTWRELGINWEDKIPEIVKQFSQNLIILLGGESFGKTFKAIQVQFAETSLKEFITERDPIGSMGSSLKWLNAESPIACRIILSLIAGRPLGEGLDEVDGNVINQLITEGLLNRPVKKPENLKDKIGYQILCNLMKRDRPITEGLPVLIQQKKSDVKESQKPSRRGPYLDSTRIAD